MPDSSSEERFIALEMKIAYQEKLLSELNEVVLERGNQMDRLTNRINALEKMYREGQDPNPGHEPPPHY